MIRILKSAALATLIGIGTLAAAPATAQAEGIYLNFGSHQDSRFGAHMRDRNVHRGWYPEGPRRWTRRAAWACTVRASLMRVAARLR
jgi:hypothetical protein